MQCDQNIIKLFIAINGLCGDNYLLYFFVLHILVKKKKYFPQILCNKQCQTTQKKQIPTSEQKKRKPYYFHNKKCKAIIKLLTQMYEFSSDNFLLNFSALYISVKENTFIKFCVTNNVKLHRRSKYLLLKGKEKKKKKSYYLHNKNSKISKDYKIYYSNVGPFRW